MSTLGGRGSLPHPSAGAGCQLIATEVVVGDDLAAARDAAYAGVAAVEFEGSQHRTDIALRASQK